MQADKYNRNRQAPIGVFGWGARRKAVNPQPYVVICNCPDMASAEEIARSLLDSKAAAAVNVLPGASSLYEWRGELQRATEVVLLIKTTATAYALVEEQIRAMHPYELPGVLALSVAAGHGEYMKWIGRQVMQS